MLSRKLIIITVVVLLMVSGFAINDKSYKNLTDRDRILLSLSYYEVSQKYTKVGKKKLAESYLRQALKIEKDVKKYASGELKIPKKSININLQDIFKDTTETTNSNNSTNTIKNNNTEKKK